MLTKEMTKVEIEKEISKSGDYVKIDNLTRFIKMNLSLPLDIKKFVNQKLAEIYSKRGMFYDAAKCYEKLVELSLTLSEKIKSIIFAMISYAKAGKFDNAEKSAKFGIGLTQSNYERMEIINSLKETYKCEAEKNIQEKKRSKAVEIYIRMLEMKSVTSEEKNEIKKKLLNLYKELGKIIESKNLENRTFS